MLEIFRTDTARVVAGTMTFSFAFAFMMFVSLILLEILNALHEIRDRLPKPEAGQQ